MHCLHHAWSTHVIRELLGAHACMVLKHHGIMLLCCARKAAAHFYPVVFYPWPACVQVSGSTMGEEAREKLVEYFEPHTQRLLRAWCAASTQVEGHDRGGVLGRAMGVIFQCNKCKRITVDSGL